MRRTFLLDCGPLGLLTPPPGKKGEVAACAQWLATVLATGARIIVPEIADSNTSFARSFDAAGQQLKGIVTPL